MFDAIVLAGGAASRLGGAEKPQLAVGGVRLLDRVLAAVGGAATVVVVGPEQPTRAVRPLWCRESLPGSGPVAAVAAGLALTGAPTIALLAADLPFVAPAVPLLLAAVARGGTARLCDPDGRPNPLAAAWDRAALLAALDRLGTVEGASMRSLVGGVPTVDVADPDGWGRDCDTWADLEQARLRTER